MRNRLLLVASIMVAVAAWLLAGMWTQDPMTEDAAGEASQEPAVMLVRGMKSRAKTQVVYLDVRAQTRANRVVEVKSEVSGKIVRLPGEKGKAVAAGELLCHLAVNAREDEHSQALAELHSAQLEYDGMADLNSKGMQSDILLAKAKAMLEMSKTNAHRAKLALENTRMVAPFAGVVERQFVEEGDYLGPGDTCVTLMEIDPMLVVGQVAEKAIGQVSLGDEVEVTLITGATHRGKVTFISYAPDLATRTYPVEVTVDNPNAKSGAGIRAGLSAEMRVPVGKEAVHLISPASLVLNDLGAVGVRIADESSQVRFKPVEVVGESPAGIFIKGLPQEVNLITVGHEEVGEGQVVKIDYTPVGALVQFRSPPPAS